jgi:hypothetical protein
VFVSIHIPKTAGTALAYLFDYGSGRRIFYDYRDDYSNARMDDLFWWEQHKDFIERQFDFIHGHFFYEKYAQLFPDAEYLACLRHPVDRILSQFNHVYFEANENDWQYRAIVEHGLDPVDYASLEGIADAQARHLDGRGIEDYFVFITEWIDLSFTAFQVSYQFGRRDPHMAGTQAGGTIPTMNARTEKVPVTQAMKEKIYAIATEDVELYIRGCERSKQLIRQAGLA